MTFREKLEAWLDDPNTPSADWMELSFQQIDKQAGVNPHNACVQLPIILARRMGKSKGEVRAMRMAYRYDHGLA